MDPASGSSRRASWSLLLLAWLLPALLAFGALTLRLQGVARELEAATQRELAEAAVRAQALWQESLGAPTLVEKLRLERDASSGAWRPFAAWLEPRAEEPAPSFALELARSAEQRGEPIEALRFFDAARAEGAAPWSAESELSHARALHAAGRDAEARTKLAQLASSEVRSAGPLSTRALAALLDARIAAEAQDLGAAHVLRSRLFAGELALPAVAVSEVLAYLHGLGLESSPEDLLLAAAARVAQRLEAGEPAAREAGPFDELAWLQPLEDGAVQVLTLALAHELRSASLASEERRTPHLRLGIVDERIRAELRGTPPSEWIERAELALYALALLAFLLGHALALRVALREARLARLKSEFVDRVSHELRTPLTAAALQAEMLASGKVPPEKLARYHRGLRVEIERLSQLVQRVLDFARLSRGRLPFEPREVPLRTVLARGLRAGRAALRLADQKLEIRAPRDLPALQLDPALLETALANLLENCARHAPRSSAIELEVACERDVCVLAVLDRGPGVPPEERALIFEPFQRGASSATKPGSGLGLALVREAARLHGGTAEFAPREGGGSIFKLRLPQRAGNTR
ncbi:MAG: hypothetical protein IPN34_18290 [Planctomycetes bacterium]|nr:hypothetical protein [Planctomycetota bacterium]